MLQVEEKKYCNDFHTSNQVIDDKRWRLMTLESIGRGDSPIKLPNIVIDQKEEKESRK